MNKEICETYFSIVIDPRSECDVKYPLSNILIITMCAVLSGIDNITDISEYGENKIKMLKKNFQIDGIPSTPTFIRVLSSIDVDTFSIALTGLLSNYIKLDKKQKIISIDGKTIRSTEKMKSYAQSLQILTAYATERGICIEQLPLHDKTNEIPVAQEMIELLNLKNAIVTMDALHCQKKTVEKIISKKGNYIIGLKQNQKNLYEQIDLMYKDLIESDFKIDKTLYEEYETLEKNRERIETRKIYKIKDITWINEKDKWKGLKNIVAIKRIVETEVKTTEEISYYLTSLDCDISKIQQYIREHWRIEALHHILDVSYDEDKCRALSENTQRVLNIFRKLAITMHTQYFEKINKKKNIRKNMFKSLLNDKLLIEVMNNYYKL